MYVQRKSVISKGIRNPWWDEFIEEHGDILLRFGNKKSIHVIWNG